MTPRWRSGDARSSKPATRPAAPNAATAPSTRTTDSSRAGLETAWNTALQHLADAQAELARREAARPKTLTTQEKTTILALGNDLPAVWSAPTTTDKDRKRLLRSLLDEVNVSVCRDHTDAQAELVLRWKGGAITDLRVPIRRKPPNLLRTDEDTVDLVRRLAAHYPDATIAHILNRQGRRTARCLSFTAGRVQSLRHHYHIACHTTADDPQDGELLTVTDAAAELSLAPSTLHRWLADGFIAGEQLTPGASGSPTTSATCSSTTPPTAGSPCWRPPSPTACPDRPSCNVSSAANSKPSTSAPDAEKACVSSPHPPRKDCSNHDNQRKPQCNETSNEARLTTGGLEDLPSAVRITRSRHPLEGRSLPGDGRDEAARVVELLLVLPDGSKSLVPAAWMDAKRSGGEGVVATLGSLKDLLHVCELVTGLSRREPHERGQSAGMSPCKEDSRAACPAQSYARSAHDRNGRSAAGAAGTDGRATARRRGHDGDHVAGQYDR